MFASAHAANAQMAPQRPDAFLKRTTPRDTISARATAESLSVLRRLDQRVRAEPRDADAWFHRGEVASTVARLSTSRALIAGPTRNELDATAYNSLRRAVVIDSTNARYWYGLATYYGETGSRTLPDSALEHVITLSRSSGDTDLLVTALLDLGQTRYARWFRNDHSVEQVPSRAFPADGATSAFEHVRLNVARAAGKDSVKDVPEMLKSAITAIVHGAPVTPERYERTFDRQRITALYEEAFALDTASRRAFDKLTSLYTVSADWSRLAFAAAEQTRRDSSDAWAWMALGLARQRLRAPREAREAFAHGLAHLSAGERARLDRVDRVMTWWDSARMAPLDSASKARRAEAVWRFGDPLWSVEEGKPRDEFLARLTYAELRWPYPEWQDTTATVLPAKGADTQRGDLYIRYGPPNQIRGGSFWLYDAGLAFLPGDSARAIRRRFGVEYADATERVEDWQPARWDNVTLTRIDSMPTQIARFRGGTDSVDVFVAARAPSDTLHDALGAPISPAAHYWLVDATTFAPLSGSAAVSAGHDLTWTRRVAAGTYHYRTEITAPGADRAGRTTGMVVAMHDTATGFSTAGFGISDPLFATHVHEGAVPRRWSDVELTPLIGEIEQGGAVAIVWENYELGNDAGSVSYSVKLTLERKWKQFLNRVRARVISAFAAMMGSEQTADRVIFHYDRSAPFASVVTDLITLQLEDTPAGNYDVTLEVTDNVTGKTTARTTRVVIHD